MHTPSPNTALPHDRSKPISLVPRKLSPREALWVNAAAGVGGLLLWILVDRFAPAVVFGFAMRHAIPMILGTSGEARRVAIVLNVAIVGFLLSALAIAYNARTFLELIGAV